MCLFFLRSLRLCGKRFCWPNMECRNYLLGAYFSSKT
jgi:hypothetical protein